jgi:C_GCAxxG_C_C family probable redox protein
VDEGILSISKEDKAKIIKRALALGDAYEQKITGCCQCTIAAIQDALGIKNDDVFKAGSGLTAGGGISCQGSCGGYTGGVMVMSSVFGRRREKWDDDIEEKNCAHNMAKALLDRFIEEYNSSICKTIHHRIFGRNFNLRDAADRAAFEAMGAHADKCNRVVGKAAAWATELILEELEQRGMTLAEIQVTKRGQICP